MLFANLPQIAEIFKDYVVKHIICQWLRHFFEVNIDFASYVTGHWKLDWCPITLAGRMMAKLQSRFARRRFLWADSFFYLDMATKKTDGENVFGVLPGISCKGGMQQI